MGEAMTGKNSTDLDLALHARPAAAREIIDLFQRHSEVLRFPDVDAESLQALGTEVAEASVDVAKAEAMLCAAREEQQRRQECLLLHAKRALAYARVFAETDPEMMEELSNLALARPKVEKPARTRHRKRAAKAEAASEAPGALPFPAEA